MAEIRCPAVRIQQGKRTLFLTTLTVRDFGRDGFYRVDRLDVQSSSGMQRLLNESRARQFGNDIADADGHNEAFLPTSVFLATEGKISYDEQANELFFDTDSRFGVCPLDVVDGQHRIEGLRKAAARQDRLLDFPISVVIAPNMGETERMLQFVTVNTKQRVVDKGVESHIKARFSKMLDVEPLPYLPGWLRKDVEKGADERALEIVLALNGDESSPWHQRIQLADEPTIRGRSVIKQNTFVAALKRHPLNKNHPYNNLALAADKRIVVLKNYWQAIDDLLIAPLGNPESRDTSVVFKYNGVEFFLSVLSPILNVLAREADYTVDAIRTCIQAAGDRLDGESVAIMSPEFWQSGGEASAMNKAGIDNLASSFRRALVDSTPEGARV